MIQTLSGFEAKEGKTSCNRIVQRREDIKNIKTVQEGRGHVGGNVKMGVNIKVKTIRKIGECLLNWEGLHPLKGLFKDFFHVWGPTSMIGS